MKHFPTLLLTLVFLAGAGCHGNHTPPSMNTSTPRRDINDVLRDHDRELLAIPGVAGVFVGLLDDKKTSCLKVMVEKRAASLIKKIPSQIEGHPVIVEETGPIRPLQR
jgi:hypothetical protein